MNNVDLDAKKQELLQQLCDIAVKDKVLCRLEKMEELHKRINAIDRYQSEKTPAK